MRSLLRLSAVVWALCLLCTPQASAVAPTGVTYTATSSTSLNVSWSLNDPFTETPFILLSTRTDFSVITASGVGTLGQQTTAYIVPDNTTYYFKVREVNDSEATYSATISTLNAIQTPTSVYFSEISSSTLIAIAYGPNPGFSNLDQGLSATNISRGGVFAGWKSGNVWSTKAVMTTARREVTAAAYGGKIYAMTGSVDFTPTTANEEYDPAANSWATKTAVPSAVRQAAAVRFKEKIYVIGGMDSYATQEYDPVANTWATKTTMPTTQRAHGLAVLNDKIYAVGGINSSLNENQEYDPVGDSWAAKTAMPTARWGLSLVAAQGKLYALGGEATFGTCGAPLTVNEEYDAVGNSWATKAPLPVGKEDGAAVELGGKIYLTGGCGGDSTDMLVYDPGSNSWTRRPPMPTARTSFAAAVAGGKAYFVGGTNGSMLQVNEEYDAGTAQRLTGLTANTSYDYAAKARNAIGAQTPVSPTVSTYTLVQTPTSVAFDEIAPTAITAAAYSPTGFSNLQSGVSGTNEAIGGVYSGWHGGNVWSAKTALGSGRDAVAGAAVGGKVYAIGGEDSGGVPTNDTQEYDPVGNSWSSKAAMPTARYAHSVAALRQKVYAIGGYGGTSRETEEYDPLTNTWRTMANMPTARGVFGLAAAGAKLYAVGGDGPTKRENEEFDPSANSWTAKTAMTTARYYLTAAGLDGKVYAIGGYDATFLPTIEQYDPGTNAWSAKTDMLTARYDMASVASGGRIHVVGGITTFGVYRNEHETYDAASDSWVTEPVMTTARRSLALASVAGKLYAVGGWNGACLAVNQEFDSGVATRFTGLTPNTLYGFKAKARNTNGVETDETATVSTYTAAALPGAAVTTFTAVTAGGLTFNWTAGEAASGINPAGTSYRVQVSTSADFSPISLGSQTLNLFASFTGLAASSTYYFRVRAFNAYGAAGDGTLGVSTMTAIETPTTIVFDEITTGTITASAYVAGGFTNLSVGASGTNQALAGSYAGWRSAGGAWEIKAAMPAARSYHVAAAAGGRVYAIGGSDAQLNEEYDPAADAWAVRAAMPTARTAFAAAVVSGRIYAVGGTGPTGQENEEYDPAANAWTAKAPMPTGRFFLAAAAASGRVYALGGSGPLAVNEEYDPAADSWRSRAAMPTPRSSLAAATARERVYAMGGNDTLGWSSHNEEYDPAVNSWTSRLKMPTTRYALVAVSVGDTISAIGGGMSVALSTHEVYDAGADVWRAAPALPTPRRNFGAAAVAGRIYALGGSQGIPDTAANESYFPGVTTSFTGLTPNTLYAFKAKARNILGAETAESPTISTRTLAAVPGAAVSTFTAVSSGVITVNWTDGTPAGGINPAGTEYLANLSTMASFNPIFSTSTLTTGLSFTFAGLMGNSTYYARVRAQNAYGVPTAFLALGSTMTAIETPTTVFFDEISTGSLTASAYAAAPAFTGISSGAAGVSISRGGVFSGWTSGGDAWSVKASMPTSRTFLGAAATGGKLYAVGGFSLGSPVGTNEEYDPVTDAWTARAAMPTPRWSFAIGIIDGKIYAAGGTTPSDSAVNERYDPEANSWSIKAPVPSARSYPSGAVVDRKLYVIGGLEVGPMSAKNERYDPDSDTWVSLTAMPTARGNMGNGLAVVGSRIYAIGGYNGTGAESANQAYDTASDGWSVLAALPTPRYDLAQVQAGGLIHALGGGPTPTDNRRNEVYDTVADSWILTRATMTTIAADGLAAALLGGRLHALTGAAHVRYETGLASAFTGLAPNTLYAFAAKARNAIGAETAVSAEVSTRTAAAVPGPAASTFTAVSSGVITVNWSAGTAAGGINPGGTQYLAQLSTMATFAPIVSSSALTTGLSATFAGLAGNTIYFARVRAQNGFGQATAFEDLTSTTTRIETPTSVFFDQISTDTIVASAYGPSPAFTALETGISATNLAIGGAYQGWQGGGTYAGLATSPNADRADTPAAVLGGLLFVLGGRGGTTLSESYDPVTDSWALLAPVPNARLAPAIGAVNGRIYLIGGSAVTGFNEEYDPQTGSWAAKAAMTTPRGLTSGAVLNGRVHVVGGRVGAAGTAVHEAYDPATDTWQTLAPLPTAREALGLTRLGDKLYAVGGDVSSVATALDANEEYDPASGAWTAKAPLPSARTYSSVVALGGKVWALGGMTAAGAIADVVQYDPADDRWSAKAPLPTALHSMAAAALEGNIYLLGGSININPVTSAGRYEPGLSWVFSGLSPNTQYTFKAQARNQDGTQTPETPNVSTYTAAGVPGPGAPVFTAVSSGVLTLNWTDGTPEGGINPAGTEYLANLSTMASFNPIAGTSTLTTAFAFTFAGLTGNTTYYARVRAQNALGVPTAFLALGSTTTAIETPTSVYFDDISTRSLTASAYAASPAFSNLGSGLSGTDLARDGAYQGFTTGGDAWTAKAAMLTGRGELAGAAVAGKLYAIGGYNGAHLDANEEYDPISNSWAARAAMPTPRGGLSAAALAGRIYALGKGRGAEAAGAINEEYDPVSNSWTAKAPMPTARAYLAAVTLGDKIHAMGGWTGGATLAVNEQYDPITDTWVTKTALPSPRSDLAAAVVSGQAYLIGGYNGPSLALNERYDPGTDGFLARSAMPTARYGLLTAAVGGKIFAIGGTGGALRFLFEEYDPAQDLWRIRPNVATAKEYAAAAVIRGKVYVAGSWPTISETWEYQPGVAAEFTGLLPNTLYSFKAKARNALGRETAESVTVSTRTLAGVPGPSLLFGAFGPVSSGTLFVYWDANGPGGVANPLGTRYEAQVSTMASFALVFASAPLTPTFGTTVAGLNGNTTYYARVRAYNDYGIPTAFLVLGSTITAIETPTSVYFDEISTGSITASAYAALPAFTNLSSGIAGVNIKRDGAFNGWSSGGDSWTARAGLNTARSFLSAAAVGGKLYAIGGTPNGGGTALDVNEEYDPAADAWAVRAVMPTARMAMAAAAIDGKIYAVGGYIAADSAVNERYDPETNTWAGRAAMPTARSLLAGAAVDRKFHLLGGWIGAAVTDRHERYDPDSDSWTQLTALPTARADHGVAAVGSTIYAIGGDNPATTNVNQAYETTTDAWSAKAVIPTARHDFGLVAVGRRLHAFGGSGATSLLNEVYDTVSDSWILTRASMTVAHNSHAGALLLGRVYAIGGALGPGAIVNVDSYDPGFSSVFTGLSPNTLYAFGAKARNSVGTETPESASFSTYTAAAVPGPAVSTYTAISSSTLTVNWSAGTVSGGVNPAGTLYRAELSTSADFSPLVSSQTFGVAALYDGLAVFTTYYARVRAFNAYGVATAFTALGSTRTAPGAPGAGTFSPTQTTIRPSWTASAPPGTLYHAQISRRLDFAQGDGTITTAATAPTFTGLTPNTTYFVRVAVFLPAVSTWSAFNVLGSTATLVQEPTALVFDEITARAITASAYTAAPGFTNLHAGYSGTDHAFGALGFQGWRAADTWTSMAAMPTKRTSLAAAEAGGKVYAIGGTDSGLALSSNEEYDPASNTWASKAAMPTARFGLAAATVWEKIHVIGGSGGLGSLGAHEAYDPAANTWAVKGAMLVPRQGLAAAVAGDKLYAIGGSDDGLRAENNEYDPASDRWTPRAALPTARYGLAAAVLDDKIYAVGGSDGPRNDRYDPATNAWTALTSMPVDSFVLAAAAVGGKVFALGGYAAGYSAANQEYDPAVGTWQSRPSMPTGRQGLAAAAVGGAIYTVGGSNGANVSLNQRYDTGVARRFAGLTPNTSYSFGVKARNVLGSESATVAASTYTAAAAPGAAPLDFTAVGGTAFTAQWSSGTLLEGFNPAGTWYTAEVSTSADFSPVSVSSLTRNIFASFTGMAAGVHYARVRAANEYGRPTAYRRLGAATLSSGLTAAAFTAVGPATLTANWTSGQPGGTVYRALLSTEALPNSDTGNISSNTLNIFAVFPALTPDTTYHARVSTAVTGPFTSLGSLSTPAAPPTALTAAPIWFTSATLTWGGSGNPAYTPVEVEKSTDNAVFTGAFTGAGVTAFTDTDLLGCTTYYFRARYVGNGVGTSYAAATPFKTANSTPQPAGLFTAQALAGARIALTWNLSPSQDIVGYRLFGDGGGTGQIDYASPLAVLTSTETSYTTGVLVSSPSYKFALRARNGCGVEEPNVSVLAAAAAVSTLPVVQGNVDFPVAGMRLKGDRVSLVSLVQADSVRFEYKVSTGSEWQDVAPSGFGELNPVTQAPFALHWDVSLLSETAYDVRAIASLAESSDTIPASIAVTITSDPNDYDVAETSLGGGLVEKVQAVSNTAENTVYAFGEGTPQITRVILPAGALDDPAALMRIVNNSAGPAPPPASVRGIGAAAEITLSNGQTLLADGLTATLGLTYADADNDGVVDGTGVKAERLRLYSFDPAAGEWVRDFDSTVDPLTHQVWGETPHFSFFALFAPAAADLGQVQVFPIPFKPNGGDRDQGRAYSSGDPDSGIIFDNLPANVEIRIYTLTGQVVAKLSSENGPGRFQWDARNESGRDAASGGYLAVISSPGEKKVYKKIVIIR